jgi:hypothetical protein
METAVRNGFWVESSLAALPDGLPIDFFSLSASSHKEVYAKVDSWSTLGF